MKIYITTRGRARNQITLNNLPETLLKDTYLVIRPDEEGLHDHQCVVVPDTVSNLAEKRQWLMEWHKANAGDPRFFLLDDDLSFNKRIEGSVKLRRLEKEELVEAFSLLWEWMLETPVVGISTRQGNNTVEDTYTENTRILRFFGINSAFVKEEAFRTVCMSDYDFLLQMLRSGHKNRVLYQFSQDQPASNTSGGCSAYRTQEVLKASAERLADLHKGFVKVQEKVAKSGWFGGETRTDVTIYWKKAYKSSGV